MREPNARPLQRPRLLAEELEPRILFSADAAALLGLIGGPGAALVRELEPAPLPGRQPDVKQPTAAPAEAQGAHEIIFIDSRVPDAMTLADELMQQRGGERRFDIVVLDADEDGIAQINRVLAGEQGLAAIHIISHGSVGAIAIGSTHLDAARLAIDAESVARWGQALSADGDLLLYGCDVAQGAAGLHFVQSLARVTDADVAASVDKTGSASIGGNWTLEFATGAIHTQFAPSTFERLQWQGVLATYTVTSTANTGAGTLRNAITDANNNPGADLIVFNIAGTGLHTITPTTALPTITDPVTIDATTDDSFAANGNKPAIIIDGNNLAANGLTITTGNSTVKGLGVIRFQGYAISLQTGGSNVITGNYIGIDATGSLARANTWGIVLNNSANNTIGGPNAAVRNVISGHTNDGINLSGTSTGNVIQGNYIGTNAAGTAAVANAGYGIRIGSSNNIVGGTVAGAGNLISGNTGVGVGVASGTDNQILGNRIAANGSLGIDLGPSGVTANDANDVDAGANNLQNFPVLSSAVATGLQVTFAGTLNSTASTPFRIEFFASTAQDGSGHGAGERYLGFANVTTDGSGNATISATLTATVAAGEFISATATRSDAGFTVFTDTSEFAHNVIATAAPAITTTGAALAYTENDAATAVDSGLTVGDADSTNLTGATVEISANYANGQDVLAFTNQLGITGSWSASTGVLTLSGTATVADYQTALRTVTYQNTSDAPTASRTISFVANDGQYDSTAATRNVNITAVNDQAIFTGLDGTPTFTEGGSAVVLDSNVTLFDAELSAANNFGGTTLTLVRNGGASSQDVYSAAGTLSTLTQGGSMIVGGTTVGTVATNGSGTLVLTFNANATNALVNAVMQQIAYSNSSVAPPANTQINWTFNDNNSGAQGTGGALTTTGSVTVSITGVNAAPTFGTGTGAVATAIGTGTDIAYAVAVQTDGRFVLAGSARVGGNDDFALARYNVDGTLDATFGSGGIVTTNFGTGHDWAHGVVVQSDDKIVVAGRSHNGSNYDVAVARYNSNGTLDTSFGGGTGLVTIAIGGGVDVGNMVALQTDGKIVISARASNGSNDDFAVVRLNTNGSLDTAFGGTGIVVTPIGVGHETGQRVTIQSDGKIVVAGRSLIGGNDDFAVVRYNIDGTLDTSFGGSGIVTTAIGSGADGGSGVDVQSDGKIVVGGYSHNGSNNDFAVVRYNADGSLDGSFGAGGKVTTAIGTGNEASHGLKLQSDGKIVVVGSARIGLTDDFAVVRYNSDGSLDTSFGGTGKVTIPVGFGNDSALEMALQADGSILLAGRSSNGSNDDFAVVRVTASGTVDSGFGVNLLNGRPTYVRNGSAVVMDSDTKIFDAELSAANSFHGATLTLVRNGGASSQDVFSATGTLSTLTQGGSLVVGGTTVGTVTTNSSGTLGLTFNANATNALVNSVMQQIAYSNSSDAPPATVQVIWIFNDGNSGGQGTGGALTTSGSVVVSITAVNDAPVLAYLSGSAILPENNGPILLAPSAVVSDVDSPDFDGGQLVTQITANGAAEDRLTVRHVGNGAGQVGVSGSIISYGGVAMAGFNGPVTGSTALVITFNSSATAAVVQAVTRNVTYENTSDDPSALARTIQGYLSDGDGGTSSTSSGTVATTPVNDAPTATNLSAAETYIEDTALNLTDIVISDVDSTDVTATLTLSDVTAGSLNTGTAGAVTSTYDAVTGVWTASGAIADVNSLLAALTFAPTTDFISDFTIATSVSDGSLSVSGTKAINGTPVNGAPTATNLSAAETYIEDTPLNLTDIVISDVDSANVTATLTLSNTAAGALSTGTSGAVTSTYNAGTGVWSASGTIADVNVLLTALTFTPTANFNSDFTIATSVSDGALSVTGSKAMTGTAVNDAPTGSVTIDDTTPTQGQTLTASDTLADADGLGAITYQWQRGGVDIVGATGATYTTTQTDVGSVLRVVASYTDDQGTAEWVASANTAAVTNVNDAPTGSVTIDDTTPTQGQTLTASNSLADADGLGAITYQWQRGGVSIVGATGATYVTTQADVGSVLRVVASYTDGQGTAESVASADTAAVVNVNDAPTGTVSINDTTPTQGQTLTVSNTLADADGLGPITYQWQRSGVDIAGATAATYVTSQADVGSVLRVVASYADGQGTPESVASANTAAVANVNDAPTGSVTIDDTTPTQGQTLTASNTLADLDGLGAITYQWQRSGVDIAGASGATYTAVQADVGQTLAVVASYTDGQGTAESVASAMTAAVANVNDLPTGSVTIDDTTPMQGQTLTASNTLADAEGLGIITYQWQRGGVDIVGATGATYITTQADVGSVLRVVASYTDGQGTAESVASANTAAVANVNDAPTGAPTITGTASKGNTLTAHTASIADADGLGAFSYQWLRNGVAVGGANAGTYLLDSADVGAQMSVQVSYTDGQGTAESLTSAQTAAVTNVNDAPTGSVTIDDTMPTQGQALTGSNTLADADGLGAISYQWQRGGVDIAGATGATYVTSQADVGSVLRVVASYTDGHGTAESVASLPTAAVVNVNDAPTGSVTIDDTTPTQGQTLTASNTLADLDGLGAIAYQWQRSGVDIAGATAATYVTSQADVGSVLRVVASYTDGQGTAEWVVSANTTAVTNVNDAPIGSVTIDDTTPMQGQTLTASNTLADADGLGIITYQWQRGGVDIVGATGATYITTQADVGSVLRVVASYTDGQGTAESVASADTTAVAKVNDVPTTTPVTLVAIAEDSGARLITQAELLANAANADGQSLTATNLAISAGAGALVDNGNGTWAYTPAANDDSAVSFSYTVTDGSFSAAGSATLEITPVNDAPTISAASLTLNGGQGLLFGSIQLRADDPDSETASLSFTVSDVRNGRFEWVATPGVPISQFTQADVAAGRVRFVSTSSTDAPAFRVVAFDGQSYSAEISAAVAFNPATLPRADEPTLNPPPVVPGAVASPEPVVLAAPGPAAPPTASAVGPAARSSAPGAGDEPSDAPLSRFEVAAQRSGGVAPEAQRIRSNADGGDLALKTITTAGDYFVGTLQIQALNVSLQDQASLRAGLPSDDPVAMAQATDEKSATLTLSETTQITGLALTAGTVWWALRAGGLLSGLLVSLPAWRHADLLAVLPDGEDEDAWDLAEDDEAERDEHAVGPMFEPAFEGDLR